MNEYENLNIDIAYNNDINNISPESNTNVKIYSDC